MLTAVVFIALASSATCFNKELEEKFRNLPHDKFVEYFNGQNFTYKITDYGVDIDKRAVRCTLPSHDTPIPVPVPVPVPINSTSRYNMGSYVPVELDGRHYWGPCYIEPADHGECAACWAVATAAAATTRTCMRIFRPPFPIGEPIPKPSSANPAVVNINYPHWSTPLSPLDLTCCKDCYNQTFCGEGSPDKAALFWLKEGIVTSACKPYSSPLDLNNNDTSCEEQCIDDGLYYHADKNFGNSVYILVESDFEIRREIATMGPVIATFFLYEDFKDYKEGIYEHTHGDLIGLHSVVVIGYGEENGVPYWLAANTWGREWGQSGVFKVKRFTAPLVFEHHMLSLIPRLR